MSSILGPGRVRTEVLGPDGSPVSSSNPLPVSAIGVRAAGSDVTGSGPSSLPFDSVSFIDFWNGGGTTATVTNHVEERRVPPGMGRLLQFTPIAPAGIPIISDTFTDDDATPLASHVPDTDTVGNGWALVSGTWVISSNRLACTTTGTSNRAAIDTGVTAHSVKCTITPANGEAGGIAVRMHASDNSYWFISVAITSGKLVLVERILGTSTSHGTGDDVLTDPFELEVITTRGRIRALVDDVEVFNHESESLNENTLVGLFAGGDSGSVRWDDFEVRSLGYEITESTGPWIATPAE